MSRSVAPAVTSVFDLFKIGIGPSSSHTVGPMKAARRFAQLADVVAGVTQVRVTLFGSLAATGRGHGTPRAILLGIEGADPETVDVDRPPAPETAASVDIDFRPRERLPGHPNAMRFEAGGESRVYYSVGGGFVVEEDEPIAADADHPLQPHVFASAEELLSLCGAHGLSISELSFANEVALRPAGEVRAGMVAIWRAMQDCVDRGCRVHGLLPGGLKVPRRAAALKATIEARAADGDPLAPMDWVTLFALAVNEENAAGGRVVTAPTNGAAGIVPAVLHYYARFEPSASDDGVQRFLLAAAAIGSLYKRNASISGAEVGCQGEVGSASSMAAAGLAEALGGSPEQVENAAEIAMEHNLGLTCDPIGGLVQIPCIERNALASVKAVSAARLALHGDGSHHVSLDMVIATMRQTGADMSDKYKETSEGGLAVNIVEC